MSENNIASLTEEAIERTGILVFDEDIYSRQCAIHQLVEWAESLERTRGFDKRELGKLKRIQEYLHSYLQQSPDHRAIMEGKKTYYCHQDYELRSQAFYALHLGFVFRVIEDIDISHCTITDLGVENERIINTDRVYKNIRGTGTVWKNCVWNKARWEECTFYNVTSISCVISHCIFTSTTWKHSYCVDTRINDTQYVWSSYCTVTFDKVQFEACTMTGTEFHQCVFKHLSSLNKCLFTYFSDFSRCVFTSGVTIRKSSFHKAAFFQRNTLISVNLRDIRCTLGTVWSKNHMHDSVLHNIHFGEATMCESSTFYNSRLYNVIFSRQMVWKNIFDYCIAADITAPKRIIRYLEDSITQSGHNPTTHDIRDKIRSARKFTEMMKRSFSRLFSRAQENYPVTITGQLGCTSEQLRLRHEQIVKMLTSSSYTDRRTAVLEIESIVTQWDSSRDSLAYNVNEAETAEEVRGLLQRLCSYLQTPLDHHAIAESRDPHYDQREYQIRAHAFEILHYTELLRSIENVDISHCTIFDINKYQARSSPARSYTGIVCHSTIFRNCNFREADFGDNSCFSHTQFDDECGFIASRFGDKCTFSHTVWGDKTRITQTTFGSECDFSKSTFGDDFYVNDCTFGFHCTFEDAAIGREAEFTHSVFDGVSFNRSNWLPGAYFEESVFRTGCSFAEVYFSYAAMFTKCTFEPRCDFRKLETWDSLGIIDTTFGSHCDFTDVFIGNCSTFTNVEFFPECIYTRARGEDTIYFEQVIFGEKSNFTETVFGYESELEQVFFGDNSYFYNVTFEYGCTLKKVSFGKNTLIEGMQCEHDSLIDSLHFGEGSVLRNISFHPDNTYSNITADDTCLLENITYGNMNVSDISQLMSREKHNK